MKKYIIIITLFILSISLYAQELANNFKLDESKNISWQFVNETKLSFSELVNEMKKSGYFESIEIMDSSIICRLKAYLIDYEKYGYKYMKTPFYISRSQVSGIVEFDFKKGKYRTTIKNIKFIQNADDTLSQQGEQHSFEWWVLNKKGAIKSGFFNPGSEIMNQDFLSKVMFQKSSDTW